GRLRSGRPETRARQDRHPDASLSMGLCQRPCESGEDHLVREISRHTEEHQRVRTRSSHQTPRLLAAAGVLKDLRPMRPKPLIEILADTFVSPADSKVNRKPNQFPNTWTSKCPVLAQRSRQHFIVSDSAFGSFRHRQYLFFRLHSITNRAFRLDGAVCMLSPGSSHNFVRLMEPITTL